MSDVPKRRRRPFGDKVQIFIRDFEDLQYDGLKIVCVICNIDLMCWGKRDCRTHINSQNHKDKKQGVSPKIILVFDLLLTLIVCDMPLSILDKTPFQEFWKKYVPNWNLPSTRTVNRYLPVIREDVIGKIKCTLKNKQVWLCVDEATDVKKNSVVNVIVRVLDPFKPTSPLVLASRRLTECTKETITQVVLETMEKFELNKRQILMFVTEDAAIMSLVSRSLQEQGCTLLLHVTCKIHALHLVAEIVRKCFPRADALIACTRKVFIKSKRLRAFYDSCPGIPEPPQPSLPWGKWLEAAFYYAEYFQQLKAVILQFKPDEAAYIKESRAQFQDSSVETDLQIIHSNYKGLHDAIEKLQNSELSLDESVQIVDNVSSTLQVMIDPKIDRVREKYESVIRKDTGFVRLKQICEGANTDPLSEYRECFNYACITSVDVERSFSKYDHIFSPKRTRLLETTVETYLMLHSFYLNQSTSSHTS